jgi:uncharacterized protein YecE (DUF72 family)
MHGVPDLYYSAYSNETLKRIADIGLNNKRAKQVYCFFNNTATVGAIKNALWLKQYVEDHLHL